MFEPGLGKLEGVKAKIHVNEGALPIYQKVHPIPFIERELVDVELNRLDNLRVIEPVQFSEWASQIVPVRKSNGKMGLCVNYETTVNKVSKLDRHPLPKVEGMFAVLAGGTKFSKLDMSEAYAQVEIDESSCKYTTRNTYQGLFQYKRIPYGVKSAPTIFQHSIESVLAGISNVLVFIYDILDTGKTMLDHKQKMYEVLSRLEKVGLKLGVSKCQFFMDSVTYLGHRISEEGIDPLKEKIEAIPEMPEPTNTSEVQAYLDHVNWKLEVNWKWAKEQQSAFDQVKGLIQTAGILVHYDPNKEIVVTCDASPKGVGAVLYHKMSDGSERPICMASRSLDSTENNYSQIDREALALTFAVKKFHQ